MRSILSFLSGISNPALKQGVNGQNGMEYSAQNGVKGCYFLIYSHPESEIQACFHRGCEIRRSPPVSILKPFQHIIPISGTGTVGGRNQLCAEASPLSQHPGYSRLIRHIPDIPAQRWPIVRASLCHT